MASQNNFLTELEFTISDIGPTRNPGVYAVIVLNNSYAEKRFNPRILYIGSSKNIQRRVIQPNHPYRLLFDKMHKDSIVCIGSIETEDYLPLEIELIRKYKPLLNKQNKWR